MTLYDAQVRWIRGVSVSILSLPVSDKVRPARAGETWSS